MKTKYTSPTDSSTSLIIWHATGTHPIVALTIKNYSMECTINIPAHDIPDLVARLTRAADESAPISGTFEVIK